MMMLMMPPHFFSSSEPLCPLGIASCPYCFNFLWIHALTGETFPYLQVCLMACKTPNLTEMYSVAQVVFQHQNSTALYFPYFLVSVDRFLDRKTVYFQFRKLHFFIIKINFSSCNWDNCCLYQVPYHHDSKISWKFYIAET